MRINNTAAKHIKKYCYIVGLLSFLIAFFALDLLWGMVDQRLLDVSVRTNVVINVLYFSLSGFDAFLCFVYSETVQGSGWMADKRRVAFSWIPLILLIVAVVAILIGLVSGLLIAYLNVPAFIATLGTMYVCRGFAMLRNGGATFPNLLGSEELGNLGFPTIGSGSITVFGLDIPYAILIFVVLALLSLFILKFTSLGNQIYAVGGNEQSARLMGLPANRTKMFVYGFNGFCSALAGIAYALYVKSGWNLALQGGELDVISAAVIGGVLLSGGVGYMVGTFFGVLLKAIIPALVTFNGTLSSWWGKIITGLLVLIFVALQQVVMSGKFRIKKSSVSPKE